jgi:hypothetical protein
MSLTKLPDRSGLTGAVNCLKYEFLTYLLRGLSPQRIIPTELPPPVGEVNANF